MRKIIVLLALAICLPLAGMAAIADIDLTDATLGELQDLQARIEQRISELKGAESQRVFISGTYRVGEDMPAGVYLLAEEAYAIFPSVMVRDSDAQDSELKEYDLVINHAVVRMNAGDYVTLTDVFAYPFDLAPAVEPVNGLYDEGGYWVGMQLDAGDYVIESVDKAPLSSYSVYDGVLGTSASLLKFEVVYDSVNITLETGEYIALSGCTIRPA